MANKLYEESSIQNIADAIRSKNGSSDTYTVSEMSTAIENIPSGGDPSEYFTSNSVDGLGKTIKKLPSITISGLSASDFFYSTNLEEVGSVSAPNITTGQRLFRNCTALKKVGSISVSGITSAFQMFQGCSALENLPLFDTSNVTSFSNTFQNCSTIETTPQFDMSSATTCSSMFSGCTNLKNVPTFDWSSVSTAADLTSMFQSCPNLTDTSIDNILKSCMTCNFTGTLQTLGFRNASYSSARIQALPSYADFTNAGWTIGY